MSNVLFENRNNPIGSFPWIIPVSLNLNFLSHYHESMEIIYVKKGSISAFSEGREILLKEDEICIFMPGEIHSFQSTASNHLYIMKMNIDSYVENTEFNKIRLRDNRINKENKLHSVFKALIVECVDEYLKKEQGYEFVIRCCKNKIIMEIMRNLPYTLIDSGKNMKLLSSINKFLDENYNRKITLEEIAENCHFSKYYFAHKLKEITGMTFVQYLNAFRLERAGELIKNTKLKITDIAFKCGFGSLRSFNRAFAEAYSMTPLQFRKEG